MSVLTRLSKRLSDAFNRATQAIASRWRPAPASETAPPGAEEPETAEPAETPAEAEAEPSPVVETAPPTVPEPEPPAISVPDPEPALDLPAPEVPVTEPATVLDEALPPTEPDPVRAAESSPRPVPDLEPTLEAPDNEPESEVYEPSLPEAAEPEVMAEPAPTDLPVEPEPAQASEPDIPAEEPEPAEESPPAATFEEEAPPIEEAPPPPVAPVAPPEAVEPAWHHFEPGVARVAIPANRSTGLGNLLNLLRPRVRPPSSEYQRELYDQCASSLERRFVALITDLFGDETVRSWELLPQASFQFFDGSEEQRGQTDFALRQGGEIVAVELDGEQYHDPGRTGLWYVARQDPRYRESYHYQLVRQNGLMLLTHRLLRWSGRHFDSADIKEQVRTMLGSSPEQGLGPLVRKVVESLENGRRCACLAQASFDTKRLVTVLESHLEAPWRSLLHLGRCDRLEILRSRAPMPHLVLLANDRPVGFMLDEPVRGNGRWYADLLAVQNQQVWRGWQVFRFVTEALGQTAELEAMIQDYAQAWSRPRLLAPPSLPVADRPPVDYLKEGTVSQFNSMRQASGFPALNLCGMNLSGLRLAGVDFRGCMLVGADMTDADLRNANFTGVNLMKARLIRTHLQGARFDRADLSDVEWGEQVLADVQAVWPQSRFLRPCERIEVQAPDGVQLNPDGSWALHVTVLNHGDVVAPVSLALTSAGAPVQRFNRQVGARGSVTVGINGSAQSALRPPLQLEVTHRTIGRDVELASQLRLVETARQQMEGEPTTVVITAAEPAGVLHHREPQPVVEAPSQPEGPWLDRFFQSEAFRQQRSGQRMPDEQVIRTMLETLEAHGSCVSSAILAQQLHIQEFRLPGLLAAVQRIVNVDGYPVLVQETELQRVRLDRALLERQFGL